MVQLPFDVSSVNATQDDLLVQRAWQLSTDLNFLDVFTVAIFPENEISALGVKFISAAKIGSVKMVVNANIDVSFFICIPYRGVKKLLFTYLCKH